ncbi:putative transmembrane protein [Toxoplasma gondii VAND]|uniref:Putative transmembrane protein n=1 Tax=Toxoplasma gondii VAND TaxID=933077 RepID=A0A086PUW6_TOXGO|nr:putative transmembrane protein [Toxoplasma gondii VAND]
MRTGDHRTGVRLIICSLVPIAIIANTLGSTPWLAFASAGTGKEQGQKPDSPPSPYVSQRQEHSPPRPSEKAHRKKRRQLSPPATPPQSKQAQFAPSPKDSASPQKQLELPGSPSRDSVPPLTVPVGEGVRGRARQRPPSPLTPSDHLLFGERSITSGGGGEFNVDDFFATTQPPGSHEEAHSSLEDPASPQKQLELPGSPSRDSVPPLTVPVGEGVRGRARQRPLSPLTPSDQLLFGERSITSGGGGEFNVDDFFATTQPPGSREEAHSSPEGPASPQKQLELPGSPSRDSIPPLTVSVGEGVRGKARQRPLSPLTPSDQLLFGESSITSGGGGGFNVDDFFATTQPPGSREEAHSEGPVQTPLEASLQAAIAALLQTPPEGPLQTPLEASPQAATAAPLQTPQAEGPVQIRPEVPLQTPPEGRLQTPLEASLQAATAAPPQIPPVGEPSQQQALLLPIFTPITVLEPSLLPSTPGLTFVPPLGDPIPQQFVPFGLFPSPPSDGTGSSTGARAHGAATGRGTAGASAADPSAAVSAGTSRTTGPVTYGTDPAHEASVNVPRGVGAGDGLLAQPVYYFLSAVPSPRQVAQRVVYAPHGTPVVVHPQPPFFPAFTHRGRSLTVGTMGAISMANAVQSQPQPRRTLTVGRLGAISLANATEQPVVGSSTDSSSSSPISPRSPRSRSSSSSESTPSTRRRWLTGSSTGSDSSTSSRASYATSDSLSSGPYLSPFSGSESSGSRSYSSSSRSRRRMSDGSS